MRDRDLAQSPPSSASVAGFTSVSPGLQTASRSIELINTGGTQVRVTFAAGAIDTPITKAYIGTHGKLDDAGERGTIARAREKAHHEAKIDE
jgi:hypothetical protein